NAQAAAPPALEELVQHDRLPLVCLQIARVFGGDVACLQALRGVPHADRMWIVFVVGLRDQREPASCRKGIVLQRVKAVRDSGHLYDADAWIVFAQELFRRRVTHPKAVARTLEPDANAFRKKASVGPRRQLVSPKACRRLRSASTDTARRSLSRAGPAPAGRESPS